MRESLVIVSKDEMLRRILGDYLDMPDLRLSPAQAQRVWQLDEHTCAQLLESLTENGSLDRGQDGTYSLHERFKPSRVTEEPRTPADFLGRKGSKTGSTRDPRPRTVSGW